MRGEKKSYRKGKTIIRQGTHGTSAFVLENGSVEVFRTGPDGKKVAIAVLKKGDVFGEMALLNRWPRTATVVALEDCEVRILTQEVFDKIPATNPGVRRIKAIMKKRLENNHRTDRRPFIGTQFLR